VTVPAFDFAAPTQLHFGAGRLSECAPLAASLGRRVLVVQGRGDRAGAVVQALRALRVDVQVQHSIGEPTVSAVERLATEARDEGRDVVVAVGGGSVIDCGKALAALIANRAPVREYLEVVGDARPLDAAPVPFIAVPTTAGTGAEVTRNAVLLAEPERVKVSLRSARMLPAAAILDPTLTCSLPGDATASTGLDALTQCIEPFVSPFATPLSDAVAREGMRRAARSIERAVEHPGDVGARSEMMIAALCSGMALANARLGAVHGFAAPLGGMFPVPHGVACARLLPHVTRVNVHALQARVPGSPALARYAEVACAVTGRHDAQAHDLAPWLASLVDRLAIPPLSSFGVRRDHVPAIASAARAASSMKGNPVVLTDEELVDVLHASL